MNITFDRDGMTFTQKMEVVYQNGYSVSAGTVDKHFKGDNVYLRLKGEDKDTFIYMREDEALAVIMCLSRAVLKYVALDDEELVV